MDILLSKRSQGVRPSPTLAVTAKAAALSAQGKNIVKLGAGEPDFDTPQHIKEAAIQAITDGLTKYTPVDGLPKLKEAIITKLQRENELTYERDQVTVSCGAKHSLYNLFQALLNPGDEVIIPTPYWVSYPDMIYLSGANVVKLKTGRKDLFKINPTQLQAAINKKTRALILNSPANPTGTFYSPAELAALAEVLIKNPHVLIVTDDIYEHILWGHDRFVNIVNVCPALYPRTVVINGVSKAYAMTGWRIGYAAGPKLLIQGMNKIQSQSTSNPASISQAAAIAALNGDQQHIKMSVQLFKQRHDFVLAQLNAMPGVHCQPADGTFYIFPDMNDVIKRLDKISNDIELAAFFLEQAGVAMVPGSAFSAPGYMRISFATSMSNLELGMRKISAVL